MITKALISKKVSQSLGISLKECQKITEKFILLVKQKSKSNKIKISGFGSFQVLETPQRLGRNPKTKESYIIDKRTKLNFKASNQVKKILN